MKAVKKDTHRIEKIASLIQGQVSTILPKYIANLEGIVTISRVEPSRDLRWAKVWISLVNGEDDKVLGAIKNNLYDIQGELNRTLALKMVPRLQFFIDTSARYADHISQLINQVEEENG